VAEAASGEAEAGATSLSICLMTAGPGARVAALLRLVRPVADELVVALDDRADAETEHALAAVADVVVRYPYREPVDRPLPWLFSLCTGRWILNLDDDEIPGSELLAALPALVRATDVTHYWLQRRWLWPDERTMIAEHPWSTDYQSRFVRNDPPLLTFPSEVHRPLVTLGPHRFLRLPLYHASLLLAPVERRLEKARRYEALRPGLRVAGGPMDRVFFLPERKAGLRTEALPAEDAAIVRACTAAPPTSGRRVATVARARAHEIDRVWAGREVSPADRRARISLLEQPSRLLTGEHRMFDLCVENLGGTAWPPGELGEPEIRLAYQWLDFTGKRLAFGVRTSFPAALAPGEAQLVPLHVVAPAHPGRYVLRVDLVHEHVAWFGCDVDCTVEVERQPRVALTGDAGGVARILGQLLDEAPQFEPLVLSSEEPGRYGPAQAPDLRAYLLTDAGRGRLRDIRLLAGRTWLLLRVAAGLSEGRPVRPLLHGAQQALEYLASSTHLLLAADAPEEGTRELWLAAATVAAARRLGVDVVVQANALPAPHGLLDRLLRRAVRRRSRLVRSDELGLQG